MTRQFALRRGLEALIGIGLAWPLINAIDAGRLQGRPAMGWATFGIAFIAGVVGVGAVARLVRVGLGMEDLHWFPSQAEMAGPRGTLSLVAVGLTAAGVAIVGYVYWPGGAWRIALAAAGAFIAFLAFGRPRGFWEAPSITALRETIGDTTTSLLYGLIALGALVAAAAL